LNYTRNS